MIEEYYIALTERSYWKAQHKKAGERIEELECCAITLDEIEKLVVLFDLKQKWTAFREKFLD